MKFAGLDIGGANTKFALIDREQDEFDEIEFPIWQDKNKLASVLETLAARLDEKTCVGVTMTAELADCFENKKSGVQFIVDAVQSTFAKHDPLFYGTDGKMRPASELEQHWRFLAASNWHATAWAGFTELDTGTNNHSRRSGFMIDMGSTTTDIIPVQNGQPVDACQTDFDRLSNGQLCYVGVGRTSVSSLVDEIVFDDGRCVSIARELFATTADALRWLNDTEIDAATKETADGRPGARDFCGKRLARMVCCDLGDEIGDREVDCIAKQVRDALVEKLTTSIKRVVQSNPNVPMLFKTRGSGSALVKQVIKKAFGESATIVPYSNCVARNQAATAFAVALKRKSVFEIKQKASP